MTDSANLGDSSHREADADESFEDAQEDSSQSHSAMDVNKTEKGHGMQADEEAAADNRGDTNDTNDHRGTDEDKKGGSRGAAA